MLTRVLSRKVRTGLVLILFFGLSRRMRGGIEPINSREMVKMKLKLRIQSMVLIFFSCSCISQAVAFARLSKLLAMPLLSHMSTPFPVGSTVAYCSHESLPRCVLATKSNAP